MLNINTSDGNAVVKDDNKHQYDKARGLKYVNDYMKSSNRTPAIQVNTLL